MFSLRARGVGGVLRRVLLAQKDMRQESTEHNDRRYLEGHLIRICSVVRLHTLCESHR